MLDVFDEYLVPRRNKDNINDRFTAALRYSTAKYCCCAEFLLLLPGTRYQAGARHYTYMRYESIVEQPGLAK